MLFTSDFTTGEQWPNSKIAKHGKKFPSAAPKLTVQEVVCVFQLDRGSWRGQDCMMRQHAEPGATLEMGARFWLLGTAWVSIPKALGKHELLFEESARVEGWLCSRMKVLFQKKEKKKTEFPFAFLLLWRKEKNIVNKKFCYIIHFSLYILFVFVYACTFVCAHVPWDWSYRMMWATV